MSDKKRKKPSEIQRVRLSDGSYAVYMGETGKNQVRDKMTPHAAEPVDAQKTSLTENGVREAADKSSLHGAIPVKNDPSGDLSRRGGVKYTISPQERREIENRRRAAYEARKRNASNVKNRSASAENKSLLRTVADRVYMWWLSISIDVADLLRGAIVAVFLLLFALLQTTLFSRFRPFGAVPDLMLPFIIAVGTGEGEKWGGITGLLSALFIECIGGTGFCLLPLLYVPVGYTVGILSTFFFRDSFPVRAIYTVTACVLKSVTTVICTLYTFSGVNWGTMFSQIVFPEMLSTFVISLLPHLAVYFAMKPFHKTRAQRVN